MSKLSAAWLVALPGCTLACGCGGPRSAFSFDLRGTDNEKVSSKADAAGEIDNAGELALDDDTWRLSMDLASLDASGQAITKGNGLLEILRKATGEVFTTAAGGTCTVTLEPHSSTNGSAVSGSFYCSSLASPTSAAEVGVVDGVFRTEIDDSANDPSSDLP